MLHFEKVVNFIFLFKTVLAPPETFWPKKLGDTGKYIAHVFDMDVALKAKN